MPELRNKDASPGLLMSIVEVNVDICNRHSRALNVTIHENTCSRVEMHRQREFPLLFDETLTDFRPSIIHFATTAPLVCLRVLQVSPYLVVEAIFAIEGIKPICVNVVQVRGVVVEHLHSTLETQNVKKRGAIERRGYSSPMTSRA